MLRTSGYAQNCTIGLQWHLMGTYHYTYYSPETSDGKFSQVECLYLLIQYMYIKSKMHTEFFSKLSIFILTNLKYFRGRALTLNGLDKLCFRLLSRISVETFKIKTKNFQEDYCSHFTFSQPSWTENTTKCEKQNFPTCFLFLIK